MKFLKRLTEFFFKINLIDLLIIAFLILLTPSIIYSYKFYQLSNQRKNSMIGVFIDFNVKITDLNESQLKQIKVGDKEGNKLRLILAEILEIYKIIPSSAPVKTYTMYARMKLLCSTVSNTYYYKDFRLNEGTTFYFKHDAYKLKITLLTPPEDYGNLLPGEWYTAYAKILFKNIPLSLVPEIKNGDAEIAPGGQIMSQIIKIQAYRKSSSKVCLSQNKPSECLFFPDPTHNDIEAILMLKGKIDSKNFLYKNKKLSVDTHLRFNPLHYSMEGNLLAMATNIEDTK